MESAAANEINKSPNRTGLEIAVIGMAGRFPGAKNLDEFWDNLKNGVESITFFADRELTRSGEDLERLTHPGYVPANGILDGIEYFDALFFDYTSREAEIMDPQVRIIQEVCWGALENAGYDADQFKGLIGIYAGANSNPSWFARVLPGVKNELHVLEICNLCETYTFCTRVSYRLNLRGPSMTIQTACSTSLVAIHMAVRGLLCGECDIALAGGASILLLEKHGYVYQEGIIISPDGHCRPFDARAKGTFPGDGSGIVVLKRLEEAIADNDNILAVIKGSATNNDGNQKVGYMAPSMKGQADMIASAYRFAGIEPESISYIEAHGTGTNIGDPIEISALKTAFNTSKKRFCRIGSVKSNVGHLNNSAGVVGFIKTVLALKHELIPPTLHYETPNPEIDFENSPFIVNTELYEWKPGESPRRAGVNSIGGGGTNVHVILEEAPREAKRLEPLSKEHSSREYQLILLSARTQTALDQVTANLANYLKKNLTNPGITLADAAYTLQVGRKPFQYRRMTAARDVEELTTALLSPEAENVHSFMINKPKNTIVFMFPGQGAQYVNMGLGLYHTEPVFREEMDRCFEILKPLMEHDIKDILYPSYRSNRSDTSDQSNTSHINHTEIAQPVLFAFEYALAKLLMHWGIKPGAMIGHSIGEYVAAHLAGVFSLEEALKLVVLRGRLMQQMPAGAMLSVTLSPKELAPLLALNEEIALAAVNSTSLCVVSGSHQAIAAFEKQLKEKGQRCSRLHTSHAFHSSMMGPILKEFAEKVKTSQLTPPTTQYISNLTGQWITTGEAVDPAYWSKHIRGTVQFAEGISQLLKKNPVIFVEVGPGRALSTFLTKHQEKQPGHLTVNLIRHPRENTADDYFLLNKLGQLWLYGAHPHWTALYPGEKTKLRRIPLPTYPFESKYFWKEKTGSREDSLETRLTNRKEMADWFYIPSWIRSDRFSTNAADTALPKKTFNFPWMIFIDNYGLGSRLKQHLETLGTEIITVKTGNGFKKISNSEYIVNPGQGSDYNGLMKELRGLGKIPGVIVHLWSISGDVDAAPPLEFESLDRLLELGFYSLLFLAQAIGSQGVNDKIRIEVITDNMQEVSGYEKVSPGKAALLGPCKIIPQEYANISCRSMDIEKPAPDSPQMDTIIRQLLTELTVPGEFHSQSPGSMVAYRGNYRWLQTFNPVRLESSPDLPPRLKNRGVYLITGGLGGIGLILAEYLARKVQARLILLGRSAFPARHEWDRWVASHDEDDPGAARIRQIRSLETMGGKVLIFSVDVTDFEQMQQVIVQAEEKSGKINGVIHAAGVEEGELIHTRTRQMSEQVIAPKVRGTLVLDRIFKGRDLDFFIFFSSLASIMSPMGQVAYSAANLFLDAFALYKTSWQDNGCYTASINWDTWIDVGMSAKSPEQLTELMRRSSNYGFLPSEGIDAFARILGGDLPLVAVSPTDLPAKIQQWSLGVQGLLKQNETGTRTKEHTIYSRPNLSNPYVSPQNQLEKRISDVWRNYLGIEKVGVNDNFFELGASSMDIIHVNSQLQEVLGRELAIVTLFNHPTVRMLARFVEQDNARKEFTGKELDMFEKAKTGRGKLKEQRRKRL